MKDDPNPVARLTYVAGLIQEGLSIADADNEHLIGAELDNALTIVRSRIDKLKKRGS